eukprot:778208-Pleurochrysis_carterae.AAC.1
MLVLQLCSAESHQVLTQRDAANAVTDPPRSACTSDAKPRCVAGGQHACTGTRLRGRWAGRQIPCHQGQVQICGSRMTKVSDRRRCVITTRAYAAHACAQMPGVGRRCTSHAWTRCSRLQAC